MIIDAALQLSNNQTPTFAAPFSNVIDFGQATPNTGMLANLTLAVTSSDGSLAGVSIVLQDSADNVTFADLVSVTAPDPFAGKQVLIPMPVFHRRFVRVFYSAESLPVDLVVSAQIVAGVQANIAYPDAASI